MPDKKPTATGLKIRLMREHGNLNRPALAYLAKMSVRRLRSIETSSKLPPTSSEMTRLAMALETTVAELRDPTPPGQREHDALIEQQAQDNVDFGNKLRAYRKANRLTLAQYSERTGCTVGEIKMYEAGIAKPNNDVMLRLTAVLGIRPSAFAYVPDGMEHAFFQCMRLSTQARKKVVNLIELLLDMQGDQPAQQPPA
jgi:transcriptional regulator with XRE-family HTH domain